MRFCIAVLVCVASVAEGQVAELLPGSRLRVQSSAIPRRVEGTLMSHEGSSLIIAASGALRTNVPISSITQVRVSQGKSHGAGAVKGMKVGAIVGSVVGLLVVASYGNGGASANPVGDLVGFATTMALGGAMYGLPIGAIVGAERWTTVYQPPLKLDATR